MRMNHSIKRSLTVSVISLILCVSMLLGTTFAWFTDSVTSAGNIIQSGNLDINMYWSEDNVVWNDAEGANAAPVFNYNNWEPGYTEVRYMKVTNEGSLSFQYQMNISPNGAVSNLAEVIDVYYDVVTANGDFVAPTTADRTGSLVKVGTLADLLNNTGAIAGGVLLPEGQTAAGFFSEEIVVCISLHMQETAGNEYQNKSIGSTFDIKLYATQFGYESDSFGDGYDDDAEIVWPDAPAINSSASTTVATGTDNKISSATNISGDRIDAVIPEGVKVADGADELTLSVKEVDGSQANVQMDETAQTKVTLDVHIEGIAEDNTVPMEIKVAGVAPFGLNDSNIQLYHVENGVTVQMTQIGMTETFTAHNQFKYDAVTGDLILYMASFSPVAMVVENDGHWHGEVASAFGGGTGSKADPYLIANASQLAYFRDIVDGQAEWAGDRTFKGQYVKLANDIILNHNHGEPDLQQFDPIGWGYDNAAYNRNGAAGKVFMGTFDGGKYDANDNLIGRYGIHGLWQNGWDLEAATGTDYTYTNCGFGLFASVKDATIKNLEIKHANVIVECVEAGIVVGLAQGSCTFENLYVYSSHIANYQRPAGGVVGEVSPRFENGVAQESRVLFDNVHVGSSCTVGSLWGDFDTPCGGVIGAYWDDTNNTTVYMKDVDVSCVLDVYSDVTAAYQWYAYRRAGMLIGNTDQPPADGKNAKTATADFLTCENCIVIYDYWAGYKYCQFTNDNNPGKNYPWVRIQASQYNGAYSNPRYGHPVDALGNTVTSDNHQHKTGDTCHEYIPFNQLYGGGQGVYGQPAHDGVTIGKYVVVYMEGDEIYDVKYVVDNETAFDDFLELESGYDWIDMNGVHYTKGGNNKIPVGNTKDYVLYKNTINTRMIRFVDARGFVISEQLLPTIDKNSADENYYKTFYEGKLTIPEVPHIDGYVGVWPEWWKIIKEAPADQDVAVHAVYTIVYKGDSETDDNNEVEIMDENGDTGDLFKMISQGKSVVMYKGLEGNIGNASTKTFATVGNKNYTGWVSNHARLDLDSYTLIYENDSNANHNWTLFKILNDASMTVGGGLNQSGSLVFQFNKMKGDAPCLFDLEEGAVLHLERGVTIEMRFSKSISGIDEMMENYFGLVVKGHTHSDGDETNHHPGLNITLDETSMSGYYTVKIEVTSYTTLVGGNHQ